MSGIFDILKDFQNINKYNYILLINIESVNHVNKERLGYPEKW